MIPAIMTKDPNQLILRIASDHFTDIKVIYLFMQLKENHSDFAVSIASMIIVFLPTNFWVKLTLNCKLSSKQSVIALFCIRNSQLCNTFGVNRGR